MTLAITGPTSGIGFETVKALAQKFEQIFLLVRDEEKAKRLIPEFSPSGNFTKFHIVYCDLTDLKSVTSASEIIKKQVNHLDVLINNAGGVVKNRKFTEDGFESSFSLNHLGHFLLTKKLLPLLEASSSSRIINVSSEAHKMAKADFDDLKCEKSFSSFGVYANVKLFNILFTKSLAEKYREKGIRAFALHPGMVSTNFGSEFTGIMKLGMKLVKPFMTTPKKGAKTSIFLAIDSSAKTHNGAYFINSKVSKPSKAARSPELRNKLWEVSEELIQDWN